MKLRRACFCEGSFFTEVACTSSPLALASLVNLSSGAGVSAFIRSSTLSLVANTWKATTVISIHLHILGLDAQSFSNVCTEVAFKRWTILQHPHEVQCKSDLYLVLLYIAS